LDIQFKTSEEWLKDLAVDFKINSLDGWDKENLNYSFYRQQITKAEFMQRAIASGITWHVEKL
jgi:hypothetical protein